ncbi:MAG: L,D-transpeptidase family protein, partial [Candidatus Omnitrophota bacterium]|nr:L,D-transpeptidase family protein [Candidatus Omnitrophota bacterium]
GLYLKQHGEELPKIIEPGDPRNAMGAAQIKIKFNSNDIYPTIRIHGTNNEESIGRRVTLGCIRLHNKDILELIGIIEGKQVRVIFEK